MYGDKPDPSFMNYGHDIAIRTKFRVLSELYQSSTQIYQYSVLSCQQLIKTQRTTYSLCMLICSAKFLRFDGRWCLNRQLRQPSSMSSDGACTLPFKGNLFFSVLEGRNPTGMCASGTAVEPAPSATSHTNSGSKNSECKTIYKALLLRLEAFTIT